MMMLSMWKRRIDIKLMMSQLRVGVEFESDLTNIQIGDISYLIFVTGTTGGTCREKSVMWRNFRFFNMTDVEKYKISPHLSCL